MTLPLNEQQRRHLGVVLNQVDAALSEVIQCSGSARASGIVEETLSPSRSDIPASLARQLRGASVELQQRLRLELTQLSLHRAPESGTRRAAAYLTSALVLLEDCHAASLTAYGDVDPSLPGQLDPWLEGLAGAVQSLQRLLQTGVNNGPTD